MNDNMTVVATTTFVVVDLDTLGNESVKKGPFSFALRGRGQASSGKFDAELSPD
jgi:hypothetical protein